MLATTTTSENEKYFDYGFRSVSFTHVLLAKLFLLPILLALFLVALVISFIFKCVFSKSWVADKIFLFFKYFCFFNLPIRYLIEMYQDLMISALVNIWLLGRSSSFNVVLVVNIVLACMFLFLTFVGITALLIYFCTKIWKTAKKTNSIYETFASFSPRSYPWIMHLLIFSISRFFMALLTCLNDKISSVAIAGCFLGICSISFCL